jgi:glutamyl-tRNA synthetase
MIIDVGPKPVDVTLSWENLYSYNRKLLDSHTDRYYFVPEPVRLKVKGIPKVTNPKLPLHPDQPNRGCREYIVTPKGEKREVAFWITKKDAEIAEAGTIIRLMELFNVKIDSKTDDEVAASFASEAYQDAREAKARLIQWILTDQSVTCKVVMPDASVNEGVAESACKNLKPNDVIQFERFGFVRIDEVIPELKAYYAHK